MKKILSLIMAVLMLASVISLSAFTVSADGAVHTLDEHNVGVDVPHFSGNVSYTELSGRYGKIKEEDTFDIVSGKDSSAQLNLDGIIDEGEWGTPLLELSSNYAAQMGMSTPSAENTYFWHMKLGQNGVSNKLMDFGLSYKAWMAWDEQYFYLAAEVTDPDLQFADKGGGDIWDGDCLQFIIDPYGPNSIVDGHGYNPATNVYPWKTSIRRGGGWLYNGEICNIGAGYLGNGSGVEIYDMSHRYNPHQVLAQNPDTAEYDHYETVWDGCNSYYGTYANYKPATPGDTLPANPFGYTYGAVRPVAAKIDKDGTQVSVSKTVYELAIPWAYINGSKVEFDEATETTTVTINEVPPTAGKELGMSMVLLNAARTGSSGYNSWFTWGTGICQGQVENSADYATAGGSNSIVLVADELGTTGCEHTFADPTCTDPYVCTLCGYKKGYAVGHEYTSEVITPLAADTDGVIKSTCRFCGDEVTTTVPAVDQSVWKEFNEPITTGAMSDGCEWNIDAWNFYYKDSNGYAIIENGVTKRPFKQIEPGVMGFDFTDGESGTYYMTNSNYRSLSYKYQIKLNDITSNFNSIYASEPDTSYVDGIYNWFGGIIPASTGPTYGMKYAAGFFPEQPGGTVGKFKICEAQGGVIVGSAQRTLCETETVDLGEDWHTIIFVFDESESAAFLYCDGECKVGAWAEDMSMNGNDQSALIRRFDTSCFIKGMAIGSTTAFLEDSQIQPPPQEKFTVTCDGEVIGSYDAGETVTLPVPAMKSEDGEYYRFYTWVGADVARSDYDSENGTANGRVYTIVMPSENVVLTSDFVLIGDANGDNKITSRDSSQIKKFLAEAVVLEGKQLEAADLDCNGKVNSRDSGNLRKLLAENYTPTK